MKADDNIKDEEQALPSLASFPKFYKSQVQSMLA
jgi:hypothetical protein